jgi:cytosolic carboxypeptidase protein 2/3
MFLDLHAHSKKKNVFAYGCHDTADPFSSREFPYLLSKLSRQDFLFQECRFTRLADPRQSQQKKSTKDGTARVFLYDSLRIPNIFTIEHSYCSAKNSAYHYDRHSYGVIGADILTAVSLYFSPNFKVDLAGREEEKGRSATTTVNHNHIKICLNTTFANDL